ncbi:MAG: hypothetical protein FWG90_08270 [Oscillospiraceae bacterium]|nr:hypothetical protein [Oscillospiraceae bacterium]
MKNKLISIVTALAISFSLVPFSAFAENEKSPAPTHATVTGATYLYHPNSRAKLQSGVSVTKVQKLSAEGKYVDVTSDMPYNLTKSDKNGKYALYFPEAGSYKISFRYRQGASLIYRYDLQLEVKLGFEHSVDIPLQTAPKANDTKGRRLETAKLTPAFSENGDDIVFILICSGDYKNEESLRRWVTYGLFIDEKGVIKKYALEHTDEENFFSVLKIRPQDISNKIIEHYDVIKNAGIDTGKRVDKGELAVYHEMFLTMGTEYWSDWRHYGYQLGAKIEEGVAVPQVDLPTYDFYGIRKNSENGLEAVIVKGVGHYNVVNKNYEHADGIYDWLMELFNYPTGILPNYDDFRRIYED